MRLRRHRVPSADPSGSQEARRAVSDAVRRLGSVIARQPEVDATAAKMERINRENHLVPRISAALGAHGE